MATNRDETELIRHLSLKWKAVIAVSLVLALTYSLFYALFNSELIQTRQEKLYRDNARSDTSLTNFIRYSNRQLYSFNAILSDQLASNNRDTSKKTPTLKRFNDIIVPRLRQFGIVYAAIINQEGLVKLDWRSQSGEELEINDDIPKLVLNNFKFGSSRIFCQHYCLQITVSAIDGYNKPALYLLIAQDFKRVVQHYTVGNPLQIAILIPSSFKDSLDHPKENFLTTWNSRLFLMNDSANEIRDMLKNFQVKHDWEALSSHFVMYKFNGRFYRISKTELPSEWALQPIIVVKIMTDSAANNFSTLPAKFIGTGLGSVILSAIILLMILWRPLSRLNTIVSALPLLAQSRFSQFQQILNNIGKGWTFGDEVDRLSHTAATITKQLGGLYNQIDVNSEKLAQHMELLKRKMAFIQQVLDTAQVIIITQDENNKILLINDYGLGLMGYEKDAVIGRFFSEFVELENSNPKQWIKLNDVAKGNRKRLRLNSKLLCQNGRHREITWLHSNLGSDSYDSNARLLSVGLDITEAKVAERHITWMAEHDSLSGLNNRHSFEHEVDNILKLSARYNHKSSLMFLDLDNFKHINDTQGHHAGDMVIKHISHTLKRILRESDILARIGGDEFAIALPQIGAEGAETVATSINKALADLTFPGSSPMNRLSASIGISIYPDHGTSCKELIASADLAMYRAKQRGRACWQMYSPNEASRNQLYEEVNWRQRIENALEKNQFLLLYQPIMNLHNGEISHYEALIRMVDHNGELVKPAPFISVAERCGLISEIDHWVLRQVSEKLSTLETTGSHIHISVNLSAHAFSDQRLLQLMTELSMTNFLGTSNIILEITETEALQDFSSACQLIKNLKNLGYKFALDDFGVGFSSFYYIQQLPVDYIKIDGGFIQDLANNPQNQILVKAITDVAKGFGKRTIAEYVEEEDTLALLNQYQVDFAQGYQIGHPQLEIEIATLEHDLMQV